MRFLYATIMCLCLVTLCFADDKKQKEEESKRFDAADLPALIAAKAVLVEKAEKDADVAIIDELKKWGRWKVVADESEADLIIRLRASGAGGWGSGHVQAFILDAKTKKTLYTSETQRGQRSVFHGYASPMKRAASGIVKKLKEDIK